MKFTRAFIGAAALCAVAALASCGNSSKNQADVDTTDIAVPVVLTVDKVLADGNEYLNDTITVEGVCTHLCAHGSTKAFLANPDTTAASPMLMCMATEAIGGAFDPSCPEKTLTVSGVLRPNTATASNINAYAERMKAEAEAGHCDTESKAFGTAADLKARLDEQMAKNPEDTVLVIGYYLEALSYALPQE